jgi:phosphoesterase RecJ-like protein
VADFAKLEKLIRAANHILLVTHIGPDGDALGSLTASGVALQQMGKQVTLMCDDGPHPRFNFLPLIGDMQSSHAADAAYDLLIALDCGDRGRMGRVYTKLPDPEIPVINIDHHITNTMFGDVNLVDPEAASTTEILYGVWEQLGAPLVEALALPLLTGLVTDTLGFRTMNTTARTMKVASALMDAGADLSLVMMQGLILMPLSTLQLWRLGLDGMQLEKGLMWTTLDQEQLASIGYTGSSSAGLTNLFSDVEEVAIAAVLLELPDGSVRVGFRCRPPYSVAELAVNLGGGGHPLAAGCKLDGPLAHAEALVVDMCKETIARQSAMAAV